MLSVVNGQSAIKPNMLTVVMLSVIMLDVVAPLSSLQKNKGVQFMSVERNLCQILTNELLAKKFAKFWQILARKQLNCLAIEQHIFAFSLIIEGTTEKVFQWKGINRKQSTRWQHLSRLKASAFFPLQNFFTCYETQQLILGTGTAIW
jgi:hypothetical protein